MQPSREPWALLLIGGLLLAWSGWAPYDLPTWLLEVFPILLAVPVLLATGRRWPLTPLAYRLFTSAMRARSTASSRWAGR